MPSCGGSPAAPVRAASSGFILAPTKTAQTSIVDHVRATAGVVPVRIKIAPDLTLGELDDIVGAARRHRTDGMIVGNTTVARPPKLRDRAIAAEAGGLSGRPLFPLATRMLAETYVRVEGAFPLIGVGGIDS